MTDRRRLYLGVGLPVFLGALDLTVISAVLPVVIDELDLVVPDGVRQASWLVVGYLVAYAVGILGGGVLADRIGSHRVLSASVLIFGLASAGLVFGADLPVQMVREVAYRGFEARPDQGLVLLAVLTGWRVIQALAAGALVPAGMAVGWQRFRTRSWLGFVAAVDLLGWTFGHLYGGVIVRWLDWPAAFWLNLPLAAAAWWMLRRVDTPEPGATERRVPFLAFLLAAGGLAGVVVGVGGSETGGAVRPMVLAGGVVALAAGTRLGWGSLFPRAAVVAGPWIWIANLALGYLVFLMLAAVPIFVSVLIESETTRAAWVTGWALTAFTVPLAFAAFGGGRKASRMSLAVAVAVAAVGVGMSVTWDRSLGSLLPALIVTGAGLGWFFAPLAERPLRTTPDDEAGAVSALVILARLVGMGAGSSILTGFVLGRIAGIDPAGDVPGAVLAVFHDVPWLALPALALILPAVVGRADLSH